MITAKYFAERPYNRLYVGVTFDPKIGNTIATSDAGANPAIDLKLNL